jgi:PPOX class probable F420-dependent enzyme
MSELTPAAHDWLRTRRQVVLVTLRSDGSPQASNVLATYGGEAFRVSVTADRAKTRNLARDPRALVHVLGDDFWHYAAVGCTAELGPVSQTAGDDAGRALLAVYEAISGKPHPDPDEFLAVQAQEQRLVLTLHPTTIAGSGWQT